MFFFCVFLDNAASEGVLASFFNSLLSKKTGSPGSPSAGGVQSTAKKSGRGLLRTVLTGGDGDGSDCLRQPPGLQCSDQQ